MNLRTATKYPPSPLAEGGEEDHSVQLLSYASAERIPSPRSFLTGRGRRFTGLGSMAALLSYFLMLLPSAIAASSLPHQKTQPSPQQLAGYGKLPLHFEVNQGQAD